jgi:phospholipid-translocating ATPase
MLADNLNLNEKDEFGIMIEGSTLEFVLNNPLMKAQFLDILKNSEAVIVCRASPSQKGAVVKMIKDSEPHSVTLAIGDGANDVNMIKMANIGVGIFGKEGY